MLVEPPAICLIYVKLNRQPIFSCQKRVAPCESLGYDFALIC